MSKNLVSSEFKNGEQVFDLQAAMKSGESANFKQFYRTIEKVNETEKTVIFSGDNSQLSVPFSRIISESAITKEMHREYFRLALVLNYISNETKIIFTKEEFLEFFKETGKFVTELKKYGPDSIEIVKRFIKKELEVNQMLKNLNEQIVLGKMPKIKNIEQWQKYVNLVYEKSRDKIIGQDEAVKELILRIAHYVTDETQKEPIFLAGPTGSGKTYSLKIICELMGLQFKRIVLPQLTSSGYKGNNVQDVIYNELNALKAANNGVIPQYLVLQFDEFDKIVLDEYFSKLLQNEFLPLLEDNAKVRIYATGGANEMKINALPIISGAFSYVSVNPKESLTDESLRKCGFIDEIIGRLGSRVFLKQLEIEDYKKMINNRNSDVVKILESLRLFNIQIELDQETVEEIAKICHKNRLGARYLITIIKGIVTQIENYLAFEENGCGLEVKEGTDATKIVVKKEFLDKEKRQICEVALKEPDRLREAKCAV